VPYLYSERLFSIKGYKKMNMVEILCTHERKWKNETCGNYSTGESGEKENDGGRIMENDGRGEFNYDIL
jgi:hypothetical protein